MVSASPALVPAAVGVACDPARNSEGPRCGPLSGLHYRRAARLGPLGDGDHGCPQDGRLPGPVGIATQRRPNSRPPHTPPPPAALSPLVTGPTDPGAGDGDRPSVSVPPARGADWPSNRPGSASPTVRHRRWWRSATLSWRRHVGGFRAAWRRTSVGRTATAGSVRCGLDVLLWAPQPACGAVGPVRRRWHDRSPRFRGRRPVPARPSPVGCTTSWSCPRGGPARQRGPASLVECGSAS